MDSHAPKLKRMFKDAGFDIRTDMTHKFAVENDPGRSDAVVMYRREFAYVEFKDDPRGLDLKEATGWSTVQREWAKQKVSEECEYWLCLVAGENLPTATDPLLKPRRAWLIRQNAAESAATMCIGTTKQKLIPYRVEKGMKLTLQRSMIDCITLFKEWELAWEDGNWVIPEGHSFWNYFDFPGNFYKDFYEYTDGTLSRKE